MEEYKKLIQSAFGKSSDSEEDEQLNLKIDEGAEIQIESIFGENPKWERFSEINGLSLCRDFLTPAQQSSLLSAIRNEGWFTEASNNQAMRFGDLPAWACELSTSIREFVHFSNYDSESMDILTSDKDGEACLFPPELLWREPLFNQLIVNLYQPGEIIKMICSFGPSHGSKAIISCAYVGVKSGPQYKGISAHVDLMRFEDGIGLVSLESSCIMQFSRIEAEACGNGGEDSQLVKVPVYLTPGSLLLMWGEARYDWKHEINRKPGFQKWEGQDIDQKRRTSITLRKLCRRNSDPDS